MICKNCKVAGDKSKIWEIELSKLLHAKCNYIGCYCQHRVSY